MVFGNGIKNIQAAAYNGARTVSIILILFKGCVYCFYQMFQALRLFKGVRVFRSLDYVHSFWTGFYKDIYTLDNLEA